MSRSQIICETRFASKTCWQRLLLHFADVLPVCKWNVFRGLKNRTLRATGMTIEEPTFIDVGFRCIRPDNIRIERCVSLGHDNHIWAFFPVSIGHHTITAKDLLILAGSHEMESFEPLAEQQEVEIGPGCWIGTRVTILGGVKIGKGCVIGAGSLVRSSIPDFSVAAGVPARVIKQRQPTEKIWSFFGYYSVKDLD